MGWSVGRGFHTGAQWGRGFHTGVEYRGRRFHTGVQWWKGLPHMGGVLVGGSTQGFSEKGVPHRGGVLGGSTQGFSGGRGSTQGWTVGRGFQPLHEWGEVWHVLVHSDFICLYLHTTAQLKNNFSVNKIKFQLVSERK